MTTQVDTDRLERVLTQLDDLRRDFSEQEQALFAGLMREGLRAQLPPELVREAEAEAEAEAGAPTGDITEVSDESTRRVADRIMAFRDGLADNQDKRLVDSIIVDAAAPKDESGEDVQGNVWVFKWDIGAATNSYIYTFYRGQCNRTGSNIGRSAYLVANFGTFWTHYRCYVWY